MAPWPSLRAPMIDEEQKKVLTSSDVLYSNKNIGEEQKKRSSRLQMSCNPVKTSVKSKKRSPRL